MGGSGWRILRRQGEPMTDMRATERYLWIVMEGNYDDSTTVRAFDDEASADAYAERLKVEYRRDQPHLIPPGFYVEKCDYEVTA